MVVMEFFIVVIGTFYGGKSPGKPDFTGSPGLVITRLPTGSY